MRQKALKKQPTQGQRYMSAIGEIGQFLVFMVLIIMMVQEHQEFGKKMVIG